MNGLSAESALVEGLPLIVPAGVQRNENNAETFKPYDPLEVLGSTAPTAVAAPKPKKKNCGVFGQIILVIIAAVVAYFTAGAASGAIASAFGTTVGATTAAGVAAAAVTGAVAGAAGSIVSQAVGVATGIQDKFSWNAVALAAIGGGVGGGLNPTGAAAASWQQAAIRGVTANVISQGIGVATGMQKEFSWASVAVAGIAAGVGHEVSKNLPGAAHTETRIGADGVAHQVHVPASFSNTLVSGMAGGIAGAAARSLVEGTDFGDNLMASLPDILGNVVGNAIAGGIAKQMEEAREVREQKVPPDNAPISGGSGDDTLGPGNASHDTLAQSLTDAELEQALRFIRGDATPQTLLFNGDASAMTQEVQFDPVSDVIARATELLRGGVEQLTAEGVAARHAWGEFEEVTNVHASLEQFGRVFAPQGDETRTEYAVFYGYFADVPDVTLRTPVRTGPRGAGAMYDTLAVRRQLQDIGFVIIAHAHTHPGPQAVAEEHGVSRGDVDTAANEFDNRVTFYAVYSDRILRMTHAQAVEYDGYKSRFEGVVVRRWEPE